MASIRLSDITFDDLDEILFRGDEEPDQTEIDEAVFEEIYKQQEDGHVSD